MHGNSNIKKKDFILCGFNDDCDFSLEIYDDVSVGKWLSALRRCLLLQSSGSVRSKNCKNIIKQHIFFDVLTQFLLVLNLLLLLQRVL